jgi:hypothetical protein
MSEQGLPAQTATFRARVITSEVTLKATFESRTPLGLVPRGGGNLQSK